MNKNMRALSLILLLSTVSASARQLEIRVVSASGIMTDTEAAQAATKVVEEKRREYVNEGQKRAQEIDKLEKDAIAKGPTMSEKTRLEKASEIEKLRRDLKADEQKWMQNLQLDAQAEMQKLGKEFEKAIQKVAKDTKSDMVFELESGRIVYAADDLFLTDQVKVAMNSDYKSTQVASGKHAAPAATQVASAKKDAAPAKKTA